MSICTKRDSEVIKLAKVAEDHVEPRENTVRNSAGLWQVSMFVHCSTEITQLNKDAERILDRANGKSCQRQRRAMANEYIRELLIGTCETA